jgi:8-oxo-dGTP pyrophosphatase MutT (NUDIX family)
MKSLSVVFPIFKEEGKNFVLLGKQAEGKKMPGIRNGFGGKCEEGESTVDCAMREMKEEGGDEFLEFHLKREDFIKCGFVIMDEKLIDFFILNLNKKIDVKDNTEMIDVRWFDLAEDAFISEMLHGDELVIDGLRRFLFQGSIFEINKTGDKELGEQVKNIYSDIQ